MKANFQLPWFYKLGFTAAVMLLVAEGVVALHVLQDDTAAWTVVFAVAVAIVLGTKRKKRRMVNLKSLLTFGHMPETDRRTGYMIDLHLEGNWKRFRWNGGAWYDTADNAAVARYRKDAIDRVIVTAPFRLNVHERIRRLMAGEDID